MAKATVILTERTEKKHSVRFDTSDEKAPINSVYISRANMPDVANAKAVVLTIETTQAA